MFIRSDIFSLKNLNLKNFEKGSCSARLTQCVQVWFDQLWFDQLSGGISTRRTKQDPWDLRFPLMKHHIPIF